MFKFFETLINPYQNYIQTSAPPSKLGSFLWSYLKPFRVLFAYAGAAAIAVAIIEIMLIAYMGRLVTMMEATDRNAFWSEHGAELTVVGIAILFVRPAFQAFKTLLMNQSLMPNVGTIFRYRAHRHVLGQSIGWFENDFAGRIANRIMQTPPAAGEVVFQVFDALTFALAYIIGAAIVLGDA
ncbi:MAG: multidrug ABC transporter ATP-binding protein, partial [Planktomarina sp.]